MSDSTIDTLLALSPVLLIGYFVLRAIIDPSRLTRKPSGPRWQPGFTGTVDGSGGAIDSGAVSGFGDSCGFGSDGGSHGGDCGGHGGDGGGSH